MFLFSSIPCQIIRSKKRKNSIWFFVKAQWVEIRIPLKYDDSRLSQVLEKKKNWIENAWKKAHERKELMTLYDMEWYRPFLKILWQKLPFNVTLGLKFSITPKESEILITIPSEKEASKTYLEKKIISWYKKQAENYIISRIYFLSEKHWITWYKDIFIKSYTSKYGMCKWKDLYFDYKILAFESSLIDHIILHEITHLIHKHHQASFRKRLSELDPDFKKNRDFLKGKIS